MGLDDKIRLKNGEGGHFEKGYILNLLIQKTYFYNIRIQHEPPEIVIWGNRNGGG